MGSRKLCPTIKEINLWHGKKHNKELLKVFSSAHNMLHTSYLIQKLQDGIFTALSSNLQV